MNKIYLNNMEMETYGELPKVGEKAPYFVLTQGDMMPVDFKHFLGKPLIINVFPSIDTKVCFQSLKQFIVPKEHSESSVEIISVSMDLPYAIARNKQNSDLSELTILSDFRDHRFGLDYGVLIANGPLTGLLARSLFAIDEQGIVRYAEISQELNTVCQYDKACQSLD
jgi:thioredoxin-dependent peroxiredoxin